MLTSRTPSVCNMISENNSFMKGLKTVNTLHRCLGYSFFSFKTYKRRMRISASVVGPYLIFAICSWALFAVVMIHEAYRFFFVVQVYDGQPIRPIERWIDLLYFIRCLGIQLVWVVTLTAHRRRFCKIMNDLAAIERKFRNVTCMRRHAIIVVSLNVLFSVMALFSMFGDLASFDGYMEPLHIKILFGVFFLVFSETVCMLGVSWILYLSNAFASFLRCVNEELESKATARPLILPNLAEQHARFCELWAAFGKCDNMFGVCILVTVPLNTMNASPWGYAILSSPMSFLNFTTGVVGFLISFGELLALGTCGSAAKHEAKKTWDVLTKLLVSQDHTPEIREQIQEFRHTCQNQDFSFSGCGFFKVGPPLIVSIASAIITYTVILYQSDNSSSSSAAAAAVTLNATKA
ncbi:uncharacterized protein LOC144142500 isoform X2 [Haemaphysalis longicornis]